MTPNELDEGATQEEVLHKAAASWFVRIHTREPSTEEVADWQRWLMADPSHREAFSEFEKLWGTIKQADIHFSDPALNVPRPSVGKVIRRWPYALAASVAIAAVGITFVALRSMSSASLPSSAVVETKIAEDRSYALPDGSHIDVGARTRVIVDFSSTARTVIIDEGEAYFKVAHETRPFIVRAGSGKITAVGTAFNVHHVAGRVALAVVEGAVKVSEPVPHDTRSPVAQPPTDGNPQPQPRIVRAGQGVAYGRAAEPIEAIDTRVATAWRHGTLKFIREPFGYVVADVERYSNVQITIADAAIADLRYTGTVIPNEIDDWLDMLPHAFPIDVQRIGKRTVLLKPRTETTAAP